MKTEIHTYDIYSSEYSKQKVGTKEFSQAVVERLEQKPLQLQAITYKEAKNPSPSTTTTPTTAASTTAILNPTPASEKQNSSSPEAKIKRELLGVDVFLYKKTKNLQEIAQQLKEASKQSNLKLEMISSRGLSVWPHAIAPVGEGEHWRCRFIAKRPEKPISHWARGCFTTFRSYPCCQHGLYTNSSSL